MIINNMPQNHSLFSDEWCWFRWLHQGHCNWRKTNYNRTKNASRQYHVTCLSNNITVLFFVNNILWIYKKIKYLNLFSYVNMTNVVKNYICLVHNVTNKFKFIDKILLFASLRGEINDYSTGNQLVIHCYRL